MTIFIWINRVFVHLWKSNFVANECKKFQVGNANINLVIYMTRTSTVIG